jgi:hypothetical protein
MNSQIKMHRPGWIGRMFGDCGTAADRRNQYVYLLWMAGWMAVYTLAAQTLRGNLGLPALTGWAATAAALAPNLAALGVLRAYLRFLREADELTRMIQVQSLAIGFGSWFFWTLSWQLLDDAGFAPPADDWMLMFPLAAMAIGQLALTRRYSS